MRRWRRAAVISPSRALRQAKAEVRVVGQRIGVDDGREAIGGRGVVALVEVGLAERLEDGGLAGLERQRALQQHRRRAGMAVGEHLRAAAEQLIGGFALLGRRRRGLHR